jgi:HEAT repeat protein
MNLLKHRLAAVKVAALDGLAEMGGAARTSQPEVEQLMHDENESVRRSASAALKAIIGARQANPRRA